MVGRLRTTLCLQYKPHYVAAGSMFLAAKLLKVKLPAEKGNPWWMQFDVAPKQLEGMLYNYLVSFHNSMLFKSDEEIFIIKLKS